MPETTPTPNADRDLVLTRIIPDTPDRIWRCWTEPDLLKQWFTPAPYTTPHAELDVRPGGSSLVVMRDPQGTEFPNRGIYLEVVRPHRLVFTDAFVAAWEPSAKPFMTGILTFEDLGGSTRYTAVVKHWTVEDRKMHEEMGFHPGWNAATDQLEALLKTF